MRTLLVARLVARLVGWRLAARLALTLLLVLFVVVQADAVVDWAAAARGLQSLDAPVRGAVWFAAALAWALQVRRPLRTAVLHADAEWLWREPLTQWDWGLALLGPLQLAALPLTAAALLGGPAVAVGAATCGVVALLGAALGGPRGGVAWVGGAAAVGISAVTPAGAVLGLAAPAVLGALALRARASVSGAARSAPWRVRGPTGALLLRDLLCLWRLERAAVLACLFVSPPAFAVQHALQAHGDLSGEAATRGALVVLCVLAPVATAAMAALGTRLGRHLDPPWLPVGSAHRAGSLVLCAAVLLAPLLGALLVAGTDTGPTGSARLVLLALALGAGAVVLATSPRRARRAHATGWWLYWMGLALALAWAPAPWGPASSAALAAGAWAVTGRRLGRERQWPS